MDADRFDDFARSLVEGIRRRVLRETDAADRRRAAAQDDDEPKSPRKERDDDDRDEARRASERTADEDEAATAEPRRRQVEQTTGEDDDATDDGTDSEGADTGGDLNPVDQSAGDGVVLDGGTDAGSGVDVSDFTDLGEGATIADTGTGVFAISDSETDTSIASANGVTAISRGDGDDPEFGDGGIVPGDDNDFNMVS